MKEDDAFVYVIGSEIGPKKIGITKSISKRLGQIKCGSPNVVSVLAERALSRHVGFAVEHLVHAVLIKHKLSGEWFDVPLSVAVATIDKAIMAVCDLMAIHNAPNSSRNAMPSSLIHERGTDKSISDGLLTLTDRIRSYGSSQNRRHSTAPYSGSTGIGPWLLAHKQEIEDAYPGGDLESAPILAHAAKDGITVKPDAARQAWFRIRHPKIRKYGNLARLEQVRPLDVAPHGGHGVEYAAVKDRVDQACLPLHREN
jgi:hypothetical protein